MQLAEICMNTNTLYITIIFVFLTAFLHVLVYLVDLLGLFQITCDMCRSTIKKMGGEMQGWVLCDGVLQDSLTKLNWRADLEGHYKHQTLKERDRTTAPIQRTYKLCLCFNMVLHSVHGTSTHPFSSILFRHNVCTLG